MIRLGARSWWFRQGCFFVLAELLGYLLAVELRDRYPQEVCFIFVFCVITALDEFGAYLKRRRAMRPPRPPGS